MAARDRRATLFLVGFFAGMILVAVAYCILQPSPPGTAGLVNLLGVGFACGILATFFKGSPRWIALQVTPDTLAFRKPNNTREIPADEVRLVLGLTGFRFDGGDLLVWQHILVATDTETFPIKLEPAACTACFDLLWQVCPKALFVDHRGSAYAPAAPDPAINIDGTLPILRDLFLKYAMRYCLIGLGLILPACALITLCVLFFEKNEALGQTAVYGIIALIAGLYALSYGVRCYLRHRSLVRSIRAIQWER
jgi:hypothetical protein